jgi:hypothetical protein
LTLLGPGRGLRLRSRLGRTLDAAPSRGRYASPSAERDSLIPARDVKEAIVFYRDRIDFALVFREPESKSWPQAAWLSGFLGGLICNMDAPMDAQAFRVRVSACHNR